MIEISQFKVTESNRHNYPSIVSSSPLKSSMGRRLVSSKMVCPMGIMDDADSRDLKLKFSSTSRSQKNNPQPLFLPKTKITWLDSTRETEDSTTRAQQTSKILPQIVSQGESRQEKQNLSFRGRVKMATMSHPVSPSSSPLRFVNQDISPE